MPDQAFDTYDVVRLEVQRDPTGAEELNLVPNPDGENGAWGWVTPLDNSSLVGISDVGEPGAGFLWRMANYADNYIRTEAIPLPADAAFIGASWEQNTTQSRTTRALFSFYDDAKTFIQNTPSSGWDADATVTGPYAAVPAGATTVVLRIYGAMNVDGLQPYPETMPPGTPDILFRTHIIDNVQVRAWATAPGGIVTKTNLIANPGANTNTSGWTAGSGTLSRGTSSPFEGSGYFVLTKTATTATAETTAPVTAGVTYSASAQVRNGTAGGAARVYIRWRNSGGTQIGSTLVGTNTTLGSGWLPITFSGQTAPVGAVSADIGIGFVPGSTGTVAFDGVLLEAGNGTTPWYSGSRYELAAPLSAAPSTYWQQLEAGAITIIRAVGDVGTLTADIVTIADDPATGSTLLRPNRRIRCTALVSGAWEPLFVGKTGRPRSAYELNGTQKRARVTITATDAWTILAETDMTQWVRDLIRLPAVLEGLAFPWDVDGNTGHAFVADWLDVYAYTGEGKVLDNVLAIRDVVHGAAWTDRRGRVCVYPDADYPDLPDDGIYPAATEAVYNGDFTPIFDPDDVLNSITIKTLAGTTETENGPYLRYSSIREWGLGEATYTLVDPVDPDDPDTPLDLAAWAAAVMDTNEAPALSVEAMTIPLHTLARVDAWATTDLRHGIDVSNTELDFDKRLHVAALTHTITQDKWLLGLAFTDPTRAPIPTTGG